MQQTLFRWYLLCGDVMGDGFTEVMPLPGGAMVRYTVPAIIEEQMPTVSMVWVPRVDVRLDAHNKVFLTGPDSHDRELRGPQ